MQKLLNWLSIKKMLEAYSQYGVTAEMVQLRYQCRIEAIRPAQFFELRKIYTSIKDGMSKASDWFAVPETKPDTRSNLNDIVGQPEQPSQPTAETNSGEGKPVNDEELLL